jgi:hypothetical protein
MVSGTIWTEKHSRVTRISLKSLKFQKQILFIATCMYEPRAYFTHLNDTRELNDITEYLYFTFLALRKVCIVG